MKGVNLTENSNENLKEWYQGPTLAEVLGMVSYFLVDLTSGLRLALQIRSLRRFETLRGRYVSQSPTSSGAVQVVYLLVWEFLGGYALVYCRSGRNSAFFLVTRLRLCEVRCVVLSVKW